MRWTLFPVYGCEHRLRFNGAEAHGIVGFDRRYAYFLQGDGDKKYECVRPSSSIVRVTLGRFPSYAEVAEISKILDREKRVLFRDPRQFPVIGQEARIPRCYAYRRYTILESDRVFSGRELTRWLARERSRACRAEPSRSIIRQGRGWG